MAHVISKIINYPLNIEKFQRLVKLIKRFPITEIFERYVKINSVECNVITILNIPYYEDKGFDIVHLLRFRN